MLNCAQKLDTSEMSAMSMAKPHFTVRVHSHSQYHIVSIMMEDTGFDDGVDGDDVEQGGDDFYMGTLGMFLPGGLIPQKFHSCIGQY